MTENFQVRMMKYIKYGLTIKTTKAEGEEYFLVGINFNSDWKIVEPSEESGVLCVPATDGTGMFYYFAPITVGVTPIFNCIEETIHYNEDVERKIELLKEKIAELQELFATETYEYLSHLQFTYVPEKKGKGKRGRPKKQADTVVDTPQEPVVESEAKNEEYSLEPVGEKKVEEEAVKENEKTGNNKEEANEIDAKIAAVLGKKQ